MQLSHMVRLQTEDIGIVCQKVAHAEHSNNKNEKLALREIEMIKGNIKFSEACNSET